MQKPTLESPHLKTGLSGASAPKALRQPPQCRLFTVIDHKNKVETNVTNPQNESEQLPGDAFLHEKRVRELEEELSGLDKEFKKLDKELEEKIHRSEMGNT